MIGLRKGGALVEQTVFLRKGGALIEQEVYLRTPDGLKLISTPADPLSVTGPTEAYGAAANAAAVTVSTNSVTVTVEGGTPPYTYSWAKTGGDGGTWSASAPSAKTTTFRRTLVDAGNSYIAYFVCTVTDSKGQSGASGSVEATVYNFGNPGGPLP